MSSISFSYQSIGNSLTTSNADTKKMPEIVQLTQTVAVQALATSPASAAAQVPDQEKNEDFTFVKLLLSKYTITEDQHCLTLKEFVITKLIEILKGFQNPTAQQCQEFLSLVVQLDKNFEGYPIRESLTGLLKVWDNKHAPMVLLLAKCSHLLHHPVGTLLGFSEDSKLKDSKHQKSVQTLLNTMECYGFLIKKSLEKTSGFSDILQRNLNDIKKQMSTMSAKRTKKNTGIRTIPNANTVNLKDAEIFRHFAQAIKGVETAFSIFQKASESSTEKLRNGNAYYHLDYSNEFNRLIKVLENSEICIERQLKELTVQVDVLKGELKQGTAHLNPDGLAKQLQFEMAEDFQTKVDFQTKMEDVKRLCTNEQELAVISAVGKVLSDAMKIFQNTVVETVVDSLRSATSKLTTAESIIAREVLLDKTDESEEISTLLTRLQKLSLEYLEFMTRNLKILRDQVAPASEETAGPHSWIFIGKGRGDKRLKTSPTKVKKQETPPRTKLQKNFCTAEFVKTLPTEEVKTKNDVISVVQKSLPDVHELFVDSVRAMTKGSEYYKELRDHAAFGKWSFELLTQAISSSDFYSIGALLPEFVMHSHLQVEQALKYRLGLINVYPHHHSLVNLARLTHDLSAKQNQFLIDFDHAMEHSRFLVSSSAHYKELGKSLPKPLSYMLMGLDISKQISEGKLEVSHEIRAQLLSMIDFVFETQRTTQELVLHILQTPSLFGSPNELDEALVKERMVLKEIVKGLDNFSACDKKQNPISSLRATLEKEKTKLRGKPEFDHCPFGDPEVPLDEAGIELLRMEIACRIKEKYRNPEYAALHYRSTLGFHGIFEQLLSARGLLKGIGDLRWVPQHDLNFYNQLTKIAGINDGLKQFNLGRSLHYPTEPGAAEGHSLIKELLKLTRFSRHGGFTTNNMGNINWDKACQKNLDTGLATVKAMISALGQPS